MDSTGKIRPKIGSLDNDAVYIKKSTAQAAADAKVAALKKAIDGSEVGEDTVNLSVSQAIQAAFGDDPVARSKKVADLKAQIESGKYTVDSKVVAKELANEIAQTIYFAKDESKDDNQLF